MLFSEAYVHVPLYSGSCNGAFHSLVHLSLKNIPGRSQALDLEHLRDYAIYIANYFFKHLKIKFKGRMRG